MSSTRWQAYRKEYERASAARVARNRRRKTREVAIAAAAKEDEAAAEADYRSALTLRANVQTDEFGEIGDDVVLDDEEYDEYE